MIKTPAPLLGFNNNVRHRGRIFHIQTEDSGVKNPRIVTHLFADGGRIVKTTRTEYSEHVGQKDMMPIVRRLMKEQHKAMFVALRAGELDLLLEQICGPLPPEQPSSASIPVAKPPTSEAVAAAFPPPSSISASPLPVSQETPPQGTFAAVAPASSEEGDAGSSGSSGRKQSLSNPALRRVTASVPPPPVEELDLAVGALESASMSSAAGEAKRTRTPPPIPRGTPAQGTPSQPGAPGRYAAPRPTAIFTKPIPTPEKQSIFGENVISEQSLDEVILSYLAEDLEDRPAK